ncbi:uncharacterized protein LOC120636360 isoform X2 [Pararge aegeria]|uniref:uncharacterized protein LOC120636360 isoform X2 n=1 Tax=Pararge aegeria TaxID=116150 RepID=UPI0019D0184B|nr:uncharacterized protein LOC120636360 isoform X2 [Pararge aegeria]
MQFNRADLKTCERVGVDEHIIKFKSSPNFKNMKKFIKSRSETTVVGSKAVAKSHHIPQKTVGNMDSNQYQRADCHKTEVQPPLPLEPPPPDILLESIKVKQEIVDLDYEIPQKSPLTDDHESSEHTDNTNVHQSKICRDFIRGTCKREGTCKYAHKYDLTQLEGVYTFCRKFQNSVCTFTNCKYVHATIFEEQHFYRTGMLPPHALQHRANNMMQLPPPPPPHDTFMPNFRINFSHPPPPLRPPNQLEKAILAPPPPICTMETVRYSGDHKHLITTGHIKGIKREWSNSDTRQPFAAPPCDLVYNERLSKKCKHCDIMEFRLDHNLKKLYEMRDSKNMLMKKTETLEKQSAKLRSILKKILKPTADMAEQFVKRFLSSKKQLQRLKAQYKYL